MIDIRTLTRLSRDETDRIAGGYTSPIRYAVTVEDGGDQLTIDIRRVETAEPYVKQWTFEDDDMTRYRQVLAEGWSLGAFEGELLAGLAIVEPRRWNGSLWVWEFHVAPSHQRLGIGRRLMDELAERGTAAGFRTIVCEAQTTNGAGIDAYRRLGFRLEGIDLSHYTNHDYPDGEIAVYMKRGLETGT